MSEKPKSKRILSEAFHSDFGDVGVLPYEYKKMGYIFVNNNNLITFSNDKDTHTRIVSSI